MLCALPKKKREVKLKPKRLIRHVKDVHEIWGFNRIPGDPRQLRGALIESSDAAKSCWRFWGLEPCFKQMGFPLPGAQEAAFIGKNVKDWW